MKALIAGGGIGGLTAALFLQRIGVEVEVFERAGEIRELGVGINMLPHAVTPSRRDLRTGAAPAWRQRRCPSSATGSGSAS